MGERPLPRMPFWPCLPKSDAAGRNARVWAPLLRAAWHLERALQETAPKIGIGACRHPAYGGALGMRRRNTPGWRRSAWPGAAAGNFAAPPFMCGMPKSAQPAVPAAEAMAAALRRAGRLRPDDSAPPLGLASYGVRCRIWRRAVPPQYSTLSDYPCAFVDLALYLRCSVFGLWGA